MRPGLLLILAAVVVQALCLTVLPWARPEGAGSLSLPEIWQRMTEQGARGFGGWYLALFGYPAAVLSIVLALASVLESVAMKLIWGGLALIGLGTLIVRYGLGPLTGLAGGGSSGDSGGFDFTTQEVTTATVALAGLVAVIFVLRTAITTFRRIAGLILFGLGGVHVAAVSDLPVAQASGWAYAPALGYLLTAVAAFVGPHRLAGG